MRTVLLRLVVVAIFASAVMIPAQSPTSVVAATTRNSVSEASRVAADPNVNVSRRSGNQNEPAVAVNPTNPDNIVVVSNEECSAPPCGLFRAFSTDGGKTWTGGIIGKGDSLTNACCDPGLAFDSYGNLFLSFIDSTLTIVLLGLSTDGGNAFTLVGTVRANALTGLSAAARTRPNRSNSGGVDQPSVAAGANSVWITYNTGGQIEARGAPVTGLGAVGAFGAIQIVPGSSGGNFGDIVVGPAGQVMVTYQNNTGGSGLSTIFVNVDADGLGAGGLGPAIVATSTNVGGTRLIPAQSNNFGIDAEAGLAWDASGGAHNGRIYLVYTDAPSTSSNDTNIFLRFSDDSGGNWSAPVRVNDDVGANSQFLPRIALDQSSGLASLGWYDSRNDTGSGAGDTDGKANTDAQFFMTFTGDGLTFQPNAKVSTGTSNSADSEPPASCCRPLGYGDYVGLSYAGGLAYPAWSDNSNSTADNPDGALSKLDIYTARVTSATAVSTTLTYTGDTTQDFNDATTLRAVLTDTSGTTIANEPVAFTLGTQSCSGATDSTGIASCSLVVDQPAGNVTVSANFAGDGAYLPSTASASFVITLEEAALTSDTSVQLIVEGAGATLSAVLTDPDGGAPITNKPVVLTLGSGSSAQSCTATTNASGTATCSIDPVIVALGPQPVTDSFAGDTFYHAATNTQQAIVFAYLASGSFVLGDLTAASALGSGTTVTWWGSQWSRLNSLSDGAAPPAFKGFAKNLSTTPPTCGGTWTTSSGNSPPPASTVPAYMAVVAASRVTTTGSNRFSGNAVHIYIVRVDPGYAPDPSHAGTGTVVAQLC